MRNHHPPQRPHWWPENEEWPPRRWMRMRTRSFARRMGCFFLLFGFFAMTGFFTILATAFAPWLREIGISMPQQWDHVTPMAVAGLFLFAAAIYWGVRNVRRMSMPLDELLDASEKVAGGDFSVRVQARGPAEVYSLMKGFNSMAERLEANDKQRRNMLADISHELRSPITIMQGNLEGMIDGVYKTDPEKLQSLYEETKILSCLVDDLRTLSLAESGSLRLQRESADLGILLRETAGMFETQAQEKGIAIAVQAPEGLAVEVDVLRIREVVVNLLANAVRYTPVGGEITLGVQESGSGEERRARVFVRNTGDGIPAGDLSRIFERFYKSSDSGGMGLGLSIAKHLVEAHGGRMWAESEAGASATLWFELPL